MSVSVYVSEEREREKRARERETGEENRRNGFALVALHFWRRPEASTCDLDIEKRNGEQAVASE